MKLILKGLIIVTILFGIPEITNGDNTKQICGGELQFGSHKTGKYTAYKSLINSAK